MDLLQRNMIPDAVTIVTYTNNAWVQLGTCIVYCIDVHIRVKGTRMAMDMSYVVTHSG